MKNSELQAYIDAAGGKTAFAAAVRITERYADMLLSGERRMSKRLDELIRLKIAIPADAEKAG